MNQRIAILSSLIESAADRPVRLLPAGRFRSADGSGRPSDVPAWYIDSGLAAALIARVHARTDERVIDYEHQTLRAAENGKPAPAAGWMTALEWRDDGLYFLPRWTDKAAAMIAAKEYRYISPVFAYDTDGNVVDVLHAGLTNFAGLDGLTDLAALTAHFNLVQETPEMDLKKLLLALGLADDKTEADALSAVAAMKARADAADGQVAALKAAHPDPAKYVPVAAVTDLQAQVAALTAEKIARVVDEKVAAGLADGRILPSMESWARQLGRTDIEALCGYLESAQPIAALAGTQTGGRQPGGKPEAGKLSDVQMAVCKAMAIKPEEYLATLAEQSAA